MPGSWVPRGRVLVFAREPRPGHVKTRMCPPLTLDQAAAFYSHLLDDVLEATAGVAETLGLEAVLCLDGEAAVDSFEQRAPAGFRVVAQRGEGLAERMARAVSEACTGGAERVLLRGSDSPMLGLAHFEEALQALEDHDLALSPALDGGYGLVAVKQPWPGLFDHPMSTPTVCADTLAQAERLGARACRVKACFDLDRWHDLRVLEDARTGPEAALCPRTLAYLDDGQLWPSREDGLPEG